MLSSAAPVTGRSNSDRLRHPGYPGLYPSRMPMVSRGIIRPAVRLAGVFAELLAIVVAATGCSGPGVPHAFVSAAQRAAISRFYVRKLWLWPGEEGLSVGCPVDVLGAQRFHGRLRVYTVVVCKSFTARCAEVTAYTEGMVADMAGTRVVGVLRDDAPDEEGVIAEARIYPAPLRSVALGYITYGGPRSMWNVAARMAGCPHWTGF